VNTLIEEDEIHAHVRTVGIAQSVFVSRDACGRCRRTEERVAEVDRLFMECHQYLSFGPVRVDMMCLIEDKDANQMEDAMTVWKAICHLRWFKQTSTIRFLNKNGTFERRVEYSDSKVFSPVCSPYQKVVYRS